MLFRSGVLGIGRTDATIEARIKPVSREKPNDRRRRRGREDRKPKGEGGSKPKGDGSQKQGGAKSEQGAGQQGSTPKAKPAARPGDETAGESTAPKSRNRRRGGGGGQGAAQADAQGGDSTQTPKTDTEASVTAPTPAARAPRPEREAPAMSTGTIEEQLDAARTFTEGFLVAFGVEGTVDVSAVDGEAIEVSITGQDLGLLLGPQGATLQAIEIGRAHV